MSYLVARLFTVPEQVVDPPLYATLCRRCALVATGPLLAYCPVFTHSDSSVPNIF